MKIIRNTLVIAVAALSVACNDKKYEMTFRNQGVEPVDVDVLVYRNGRAPETIYSNRVAPASDGYYVNTNVEGKDVRVEARFTHPGNIGHPSTVRIQNKKRVIVEVNTSAGTVYIARTYTDDDDDDFDDDDFDDDDFDDYDDDMDDYDDDDDDDDDYDD